MTGSRVRLGLVLALTALAPAAWTAPVDEISDEYQAGVEALKQGNEEEALRHFTRVLALEPSHEAAYELWKQADTDLLLDMLVKGGQYELVASRLMELASLGRAEREDDPDAIRALVRQLEGDDVVARRKAIIELSANHGEYAVPYMLPHLADPVNDDRRVSTMHALTEMSTDVVLPLVAALRAEDPFLRRNVALVLGYIGDPRAGAALAWHAMSDPDGGVAEAAKEAAMKCGSNGEPLAEFLRLGDDYHHENPLVLRPFDYSRVVWTWGADGLEKTEVPRWLYADELSKNAYYDALEVDPGSLDALAGVARAYAAQLAEFRARASAGVDVADWQPMADGALLAIETSGIAACDRALSWCVADGESGAGVELCRALGDLCTEPTGSLRAALASSDGALSAEAAVALGHVAARSGRPAGGDVVAALGRAASLEVVRFALVIDSDAERGAALARALSGPGMVVHHWERGATALSMLSRVPGVDAVLLAETLEDLTPDQVLRALAANERTANTPVLMITDDPERAQETWGERLAGTITSAADLDQVEAAMEGGMGGERERADDLAARAAASLAALARAGTDVAQVADVLAGTLASRPDSVTVPAMSALGAAGDAAHFAALVAVVGDDSRSDEARAAAAAAIAEIAGRTGAALDEGTVATLGEVLASDAAASVRSACARALGAAGFDARARAELVRNARVRAANPE